MRLACPPLAVFACLLVSATAPADDKSPEGDLAKIQGKWSTMIGPDKTVPMTMEVKGSELTILVTTFTGRGYTIKGQLKVDESAKPKTMDWIKLATNGKEGPDIQSIYELDGDTLKICGGGPGRERPTIFKGDDSTDARSRSLVLKRDKDEPKRETSKDAPK
jgi:uncharacterized protein (TIGR03067 family)